MKFRTVS